MPFYFKWGKTFEAISGEFWPWQITQIRMRAEELFERRPQDDDLECAAQIRASIIPFEMYGYGFVLKLHGRAWTLEVASFPSHAEPGTRMRKARRQREQKERRERSDSAKKARGEKRGRGKKGSASERVISTVMSVLSCFLSNLYNISRAAYAELEQLRLKAALFLEHLERAIEASPWTAREEIWRWLLPSLEDCRAANIAAWVQRPLPRGFQRERRLFFAEFMPMWIDTIGPIEIRFVRAGQSIFGELFPEGECVT